MIYLNNHFSLIIQIQSFWFFTLAAVETQMLPSEEGRPSLIESLPQHNGQQAVMMDLRAHQHATFKGMGVLNNQLFPLHCDCNNGRHIILWRTYVFDEPLFLLQLEAFCVKTSTLSEFL